MKFLLSVVLCLIMMMPAASFLVPTPARQGNAKDIKTLSRRSQFQVQAEGKESGSDEGMFGPIPQASGPPARETMSRTDIAKYAAALFVGLGIGVFRGTQNKQAAQDAAVDAASTTTSSTSDAERVTGLGK